MIYTVNKNSVLKNFMCDENLKYDHEKKTVTGKLSVWKVTATVAGALAVVAAIVCFVSFFQLAPLARALVVQGFPRNRYFEAMVSSLIFTVAFAGLGALGLASPHLDPPQTLEEKKEQEMKRLNSNREKLARKIGVKVENLPPISAQMQSAGI